MTDLANASNGSRRAIFTFLLRDSTKYCINNLYLERQRSLFFDILIQRRRRDGEVGRQRQLPARDSLITSRGQGQSPSCFARRILSRCELFCSLKRFKRILEASTLSTSCELNSKWCRCGRSFVLPEFGTKWDRNWILKPSHSSKSMTCIQLSRTIVPMP
jgi:hypothetical protein